MEEKKIIKTEDLDNKVFTPLISEDEFKEKLNTFKE